MEIMEMMEMRKKDGSDRKKLKNINKKKKRTIIEKYENE